MVRGFGYKGRPTPSTPAPEPPSDEQAERIAALQAEIDAAFDEHERLSADAQNGDPDYALLRRVELSGAHAWRLHARLYTLQRNPDAARKASATANEHAAMANKLEQNSAVDRLAELERMLSASRRDAQRLAKLE